MSIACLWRRLLLRLLALWPWRRPVSRLTGCRRRSRSRLQPDIRTEVRRAAAAVASASTLALTEGLHGEATPGPTERVLLAELLRRGAQSRFTVPAVLAALDDVVCAPSMALVPSLINI